MITGSINKKGRVENISRLDLFLFSHSVPFMFVTFVPQDLNFGIFWKINFYRGDGFLNYAVLRRTMCCALLNRPYSYRETRSLGVRVKIRFFDFHDGVEYNFILVFLSLKQTELRLNKKNMYIHSPIFMIKICSYFITKMLWESSRITGSPPRNTEVTNV
jgi:hypothetical protein